jgi:hypothetical protein
VHITAQQIADSNMQVFGKNDYVIEVEGDKLDYVVISNNQIDISAGQVILQGHRGAVDAGTVEHIVIENGSAGAQRSDLIIARYQLDPDTHYESMTLMVVKGIPGDGDPVINADTIIRDGAIIHDMALYRVNIDGINITTVDTLFDIWKRYPLFDTKNEATAFSLLHPGQAAYYPED